MRAGQRREMGLGSMPAVTLARAPEKAADARRLVKAGKGPDCGAACCAGCSSRRRNLWNFCAQAGRYNRDGLQKRQAPGTMANHAHDLRRADLRGSILKSSCARCSGAGRQKKPPASQTPSCPSFSPMSRWRLPSSPSSMALHLCLSSSLPQRHTDPERLHHRADNEDYCDPADHEVGKEQQNTSTLAPASGSTFLAAYVRC